MLYSEATVSFGDNFIYFWLCWVFVAALTVFQLQQAGAPL